MKVWKDLKHVNNSDTADLSREKSAWNISEKALSLNFKGILILWRFQEILAWFCHGKYILLHCKSFIPFLPPPLCSF